MKEYSNGFDTKDKKYHISVFSNKGTITLGIDMGCDGYFADLSKNEIDELIVMLKDAKKKVVK